MLGESKYDKVTSFLMAVVLGAMLVVGWLALVYVSNQAYASRVTAPLQIIEVGGGGGSPDGTPGSTEKIDVAGADAAPMASNNPEEAGDFEEPSVEQTPARCSTWSPRPARAWPRSTWARPCPTAARSPVANARPSSARAGQGWASGPAMAGSLASSAGASCTIRARIAQEYARQLDALGVELAVVSSPEQLLYISHFAEATPAKRHGTGRTDHRLYFLWQGRGRKQSDIELFRKAGVEIGNENVFQFYSAAPSSVWPSSRSNTRGEIRAKSA